MCPNPATSLIFSLVLLPASTSVSLAEYRLVLIAVRHAKDNPSRVTIHSDDKKDRRESVSFSEAHNAIREMKGWGSTVGVFVVMDRGIAREDRKLLFAAIDDNLWLDLAYYGNETPKHLAEYFLEKEKGR